MFDLEKAIAAWRRSFRYRRVFFEDDLEELERHLRDHVAGLVEQGWAEKEAFGEAVRSVGDYGAMEAEYRKVFWAKARHKRALINEIIGEVMMLKSYLKSAVRHLFKRRGYVVINVGGLALGLACCVLILLFVRDELSYDRFHEKADRIYRVAVDSETPGTPVTRFATNSRHVADALRADYPEAEQVVRLRSWSFRVERAGEYIFDDAFFAADSSFFEVFSYDLVRGDPKTALREPYTLVLTEEMAGKYFGDEDPLGQTLTLDDTLTVTVTGVVAAPPGPSHFTFDFLFSWSTFEVFAPSRGFHWFMYRPYTYVLLHEGVEAAAFEEKIAGLIMNRHPFDEENLGGFRASLVLEPITDIYLHVDRRMEIGPMGDARYAYIFGAIAAFVLLIACINFVNLATARSVERAREVGVRKVVGAHRATLIRQFMIESILVAFLALVGAMLLVVLALPPFNNLTGKALTTGVLATPEGVLVLLGLMSVVGVLAGSYPALALSRFRPVEVLKGVFRAGRRGVRLRQGLVVFQFAVSVVLILGTLVVYQQLRYMQRQNLGFDKEQVLVVDVTRLPDEVVLQRREVIEQAFSQPAAVQKLTASGQVPGHRLGGGVMFPEGMPDGASRELNVISIDEAYLDVLGIELAAGRSFSEAFETDTHEAMLLNETAVEYLGWGAAEEAVGRRITTGNDGRLRTVVGVIKDYHHTGLQTAIEPMLAVIVGNVRYFALRIATDDVPATTASVNRIWEQLFPDYPFEYFFLDEAYDRQYRTEQRLAMLSALFTALAVLIACLGLFGLASFVTAQRTKEIGVRKVLGASVGSLITLVAKDFMKLVVVAFIVAAPVAYLAMNRWLEDFAYRVDISWSIFLLGGLAALGIALLTVSYQSVKAALTNPVETLRYE